MLDEQLRREKGCVHSQLLMATYPIFLQSRYNMEVSSTPLQNYLQDAFKNVEGWLLPAAVAGLSTLESIARLEGVISGGACEIGVHHGRFFLALLACTNLSERSLAIDVFDDQSLNVDRSGNGSRLRFAENLAKFSPHADHVDIMQLDSLALNSEKIVGIGQRFAPFRLFSIDGGHTTVHAFNDLLVAQDLIANGGLVIVDDYFHQDWPSVTEGVARYFWEANAKLAPLCVAGGKLFMTTFSYHERYLSRLHSALLTRRPKSFAKYVTIHGYRAVSFRLHHEDPIVT